MRKNVTNKQMKSTYNLLRSGVFSMLFGGVKYLPSPWFDFLRYIVLKLFCKSIHSMYLGENITIWFPWNISIGRNVSINNSCTLDGTGGIVIGNNTRIAGNVGLHTADHRYDAEGLIRKQGFVIDTIKIEDNVWVGYGVNVVKGVTIGRNSVIGCGAVVTKDVPNNSVVVGNPAKIIKRKD